MKDFKTKNGFFTGNVGIGTTDPARILHLKNSNSCIAFQTPIDANGSAFAQIKSGRDGDSGYSSTLEFATTESTTAVSNFGNNGSGGSGFATRMVIDSSGNVGIGTTNPSAELEVNGQIISNRRFMSENSLELVSDYNGNGATSIISFKIDGQDASDEKMRINSSGNVGIGTTNPRGKLEIGESSEDAFYVDFQSGEGITNFKSPYSGVNGNRGGWQFITKDGGTTPYNALRINSVGNVGIGTASPNTSLHVTTSSGNGDGVVFIQNTLADYGMGLKVKGGGNADNQRFALKVQNANGDDILFAQSRTGNVGIGTANPTSRFQVEEPVSANQTTALFVRNQSSHTSLGGATIAGFHNASDYVMQIKTNGNVGIGTTNPNAKLEISGGGTGVWLKTNNLTNRSSNTMAGVAPTPTDENSFEIGPGYINLNRDDTTTVKQIQFGKNGSIAGYIETFASSTNYSTASDYRLKENVVAIDGAIERINKLKPCRFNFIKTPEEIVDGFIAHEVQGIVPEAISGEKDEQDEGGNIIPQGIDQAKLVPLLTAAIQEQQTIIEDLKARIETLES